MANVKLSQIASGGAINAATDLIVGVRSGTTDLLLSLAAMVIGPASAIDNAIARFDGTTGKLLQNSLAVVDDLGNIGLGTTAPGFPIDIQRQGTDINGTLFATASFADASGSSQMLMGYDDVASESVFVGNPTTNALSFYMWNGGGYQRNMQLYSNGFTAIGTGFTPAFQLDVQGPANNGLLNVAPAGTNRYVRIGDFSNYAGIQGYDGSEGQLQLNPAGGVVGIGAIFLSQSTLGIYGNLSVGPSAALTGAPSGGILTDGQIIAGGDISSGTSISSTTFMSAGTSLTVATTTTFGGIAYTWPGSQGPGLVLTTNGSGALAWTAAGAPGGAAGDVQVNNGSGGFAAISAGAGVLANNGSNGFSWFDITTALAAKADLAGATFSGAISATNLSNTNTGDQNIASVLGLSGITPAADNTYALPTSITIVSGIITAIS